MKNAIHGVAVDAGSGLEAAIRTARGNRSMDGDLLTFKRTVLEVLGTEASTVLVDAACGADLIDHYPDDCAPMLAYEADVYHISDEDRITVLPENLSYADYGSLGVSQLKFFMYYAPDDDPALNARKQEVVAAVGQGCRDHNLRYLMEPLVYHPDVPSGTAEYAALKPDLVRRSTEIFADEKFQADVLKVEIPVDLNFVEGFGEPLMSRKAALNAFRDAAAPANGHDLVYLSAGVAFEWFEASLKMAQEAGVSFNGFMCGRAIWADSVEIFGNAGETGLREWLAETGRARLNRLIATLQ
ncbi:MAG: tagatose 1,6-diphosphate aldolase [Stappiaceae bacterium]